MTGTDSAIPIRRPSTHGLTPEARLARLARLINLALASRSKFQFTAYQDMAKMPGMNEYQMSISVPALVAAFSAFCIWLTVRIINRRERWAKWTLATVIIGLPVLYVASFGPACWLTKRDPMTFDRIAPGFYWPIGWVSCRAPRPVRKAISWYAKLDGNSYILLVPAEPSGGTIVGM
ncbi:MAG TPA: hypothetical protein VKU82_15785 [Planctomycetaceae bacterium]|nr:hypothetical protein [Planctomycetaceae bacterium]